MSNDRQPAKDDLCRSVPFRAVSAPADGDGRTLDGYAAMFNSPTRIDSWEGRFDERISPGAFKKSLRENTPKMQFDHGQHPLIGSIPIGRFDTVEEDNTGLHVVGRLSDNWLIQPVRDAISDGGITGMSFRFSVIRDEWCDQAGKPIKDPNMLWDMMSSSDDADTPTRTLKEVRISEAGPVVWPAYSDTSVGVRSNNFPATWTGNSLSGNKFIVDLGSRESLARAAFVIDAAVRNTGDVDEAEKVTPETHDAPPSTEDEAVRHSEEPPVTSSEAVEHPSGEAVADTDRKSRIRARNRENAAILSAIKMGEAFNA